MFQHFPCTQPSILQVHGHVFEIHPVSFNIHYFMESASRIILFDFTSITPPVISYVISLSSWSTILTKPFSSVEIIGAWSFKTWNDPFLPGTLTDLISPSKIFLSGVIISIFITAY